MNNIEIRLELTKKNMKQWQLAELLGVSESVICRRLRKELPKEEKEKILTVIKNYEA